MGSAIAYDWLYNDLSPEDRDIIGGNLAKRAQESYEASSNDEYNWSNWWRKAYIQNHLWINNSALGLAALVLEREDGRAEGWLSLAIDRISRVSNLLSGVTDGSWHEGIAYQDYGLALSLPFYYNLQRLRSQDLLPHRYLKNLIYWRVYNSLPQSGRFLLSFADMDWSWGNAYGPQGILRLAAREYRDGHAEWLAQEISTHDGRYDNVYSAPWYVFEFLYYDPSVDPVPPDNLSNDRAFSDLGGVIWRTGWGDNDLEFGLKAGATGGRYSFDRFVAQQPPFDPTSSIDSFDVGHEHEDAGSFYLYRGGQELTSEMTGNGLTGTEYHNSLLVDGIGQRHESNVTDPSVVAGTAARMEQVEWTENFSYLVADITRRYDLSKSSSDDGGLDEFRRYVLFSKPDYLVMVDRLRDSVPHDYDWVAHFSSQVSSDGGWLKGEGDGDQVLGIKVLSPQEFVPSVGDDGKSYVRIRPASKGNNATFVTLLYPTSSSNWEQKPTVSSLGSNDQIAGVRVEMDGTQDHLVRYGDHESASIGEYATDAKVASVIKGSDGSLKRLFVGSGRLLSDNRGDRALVRAAATISALEVVYEGASLSLYGDSLEAARIYAPGVDAAQVRLNGRPAKASRSGDYLIVSA